ncbi:fibronectin-binding protein [Mycobacterium sp. CBMA293]|uniref:fibronectin-binding protein n=1 Tax=unclassified Mycolicibacterium TaxID=2636767 RepID=UPI0012DF475A|nr:MULTISPECIES: fibronectin-binding protein [unclassified Mycolicibacterium]MUL46323.1 fibronectin-binding protein [Mycolicibacterium sp. CBMA 360]MUL57165.1 fibronectin-binding protein [Mycolicibacterium sp. CBMA 335]MUL70205.1 fibronectin-binding protein [Mycolicibacterium sp. CBMA 311]MUL92253.1 fibronectin-binding protein [Mycolicibacterium sp. CBMA 230]MUM11109.1 fibronectin-binding protein [Mycolicibacterium sp. CBMA 293]
MNTRSIAIALTALSLATSTPTAGALRLDQPGQPCTGLGIVLCHFLPIAPDMDSDIDLTKQLNPSEAVLPPPDPAPRADMCATGCA